MRIMGGTALLLGACLCWAAQAGQLKVLYNLPANNDGGQPSASLTSGDGVLYGTTAGGGQYGMGTVFDIDPATGAEVTLASLAGAVAFSPEGGVVEVDGLLYFVASADDPKTGAPTAANIYKLNPATKALEYQNRLPAGSGPGASSVGVSHAGLVSVGHELFGTTPAGGANGLGSIFRFDTQTGQIRTLYSFAGGNDGASPLAGLTYSKGVLYGTTYAGGAANAGTVFRFDNAMLTEAVLYAFPSGGGVNPAGPLLVSGNMLYGTTMNGGSAGDGTVFDFDTGTGVASTLYSFQDNGDGAFPASGLVSFQGALYGTTLGHYVTGSGATPVRSGGTLFKIDPASGTETTVHAFLYPSAAGNIPMGSVAVDGGHLYGVTSQGGLTGNGSVYRVDPATTALTPVHQFAGGSASQPTSGLLYHSGLLYGVTPAGGQYGYGSLFTVNPATGATATVYSFTGRADGYGPQSVLTQSGRFLFGAALGGQLGSGSGTVFGFNPATHRLSVIYTAPGNTPISSLTTFGLIYGLEPSQSSVFSVQARSGPERSVGEGGNLPGLTYLRDLLYGTAYTANPQFSESTITTTNVTTGAFSNVFTFGASSFTGRIPNSPLLLDEGLLYGTTLNGGAFDSGTVYVFDPAQNTASLLHSFNPAKEGTGFFGSASGLIADGKKLYGTARNGPGDGKHGTLYAVDKITGVLSTLAYFDEDPTGGEPTAGLTRVKTILYGTTSRGGSENQGTVFSYNP